MSRSVAQSVGSRLAAKDETATTPEATIPSDASESHVDILVTGALAVDLCCDFTPLNDCMTGPIISPQSHTSNPAIITTSLGGVGHNVAYAAHLLGSSVNLCSVVGRDLSGRMALDMLREEGLKADYVKQRTPSELIGRRTAQYVAFNDGNKELVMAMADMSLFEDCNDKWDPSWRYTIKETQPKWLVVDANWDSATLRDWTAYGKAAGSKVILEPVSAAKAARLFDRRPVTRQVKFFPQLGIFPDHQVDIVTPNEIELGAMLEAARRNTQLDRPQWWHVINSFGLPGKGSDNRLVSITNYSLVARGIPQKSISLLPFIPCVITKLGREGVLLTQLLQHDDPRLTSATNESYIVSRITQEGSQAAAVYIRLFPPAEVVPDKDVVSVNGVGDTFLGVLVAGLARTNGQSLERLIEIAQQGSVMTLKSRSAVHRSLGQLRSQLKGVEGFQESSRR